MSRLSIEIDPEQHRQIKTLATFEGMSMKDFILSKVLKPKEKKMDPTEKLLSHPENKKRLLEAINSDTKDHLVFETIEDLKDALRV